MTRPELHARTRETADALDRALAEGATPEAVAALLARAAALLRLWLA